jgi:hypothetical protein
MVPQQKDPRNSFGGEMMFWNQCHYTQGISLRIPKRV